MNLNCILCKHRNNKDSCWEAINKADWKCPSLSNIYYSKFIYHFPFKQIDKVVDKIKYIQAERYYSTFSEDYTENDELKHIWGVKSYFDLSMSKCNLMTMNDLDITYDKKKHKYLLGVETMAGFDSPADCKNYMNWLLEEFTKWMRDNNYNTDVVLDMYEVFSEGLNVNTEFDDIETLYATFKLLVKGFEGNGFFVKDCFSENE